MLDNPTDLRDRRTILIVEDDPITRTVVVGYFEMAGLQVYQAESGAEALAILQTYGQAIDWLFTDICLPGEISGWIVGAEFNLNHPLRPVIYATATAEPGREQAAGSVFIQKPYSPKDVFAVFQTLESRAAEMADIFRPFYDRDALHPLAPSEKPDRPMNGAGHDLT